jgi:hypothetical protein
MNIREPDFERIFPHFDTTTEMRFVHAVYLNTELDLFSPPPLSNAVHVQFIETSSGFRYDGVPFAGLL